MKFNVGDRVKIKEDLEYDEIYGGVYVTDTMLKYRGEVAEIAEVNSNFNDRYILKDCGIYWFHKDMLEPINDSDDYISKGRDDSIFETEKTKEKTSLEKALELLNMTEEEMLKEYDKINKDKLIDNMIKEFDEFCDKYNMSECESKCKYKGNSGICSMLFAMEYLQEKGLLKENINENN